jgi:hypothetical protein
MVEGVTGLGVAGLDGVGVSGICGADYRGLSWTHGITVGLKWDGGIESMTFALNKKARKRMRRRAKSFAKTADKLEREGKVPIKVIAMVREISASTAKSALRKKRRRKKPVISN